MANDIWDDNFNWEAPAPATTPAQESPQAAASGTAAAATPGLKSQTGMPDWYSSWFRDAFKDKTNWFKGAGNAENAFQKYFANGPQFGQQVGGGVNQMQDVFSQYFSGGPRYQAQTDQMVSGLPEVWNKYQQLPGQIENKRQAMIDQIYANLPRMQELYQPSMEGMSKRGILNSDVTGKALTDIQSNVNRDVLGKTAEANTWAADKNIGVTENMSTVLNNVINGMLGASGQYTGQGTSALTGAGNVLGNTINASNLYSGFGKDAAGIGNNQQSLANELIKLMQQSTTYNV